MASLDMSTMPSTASVARRLNDLWHTTIVVHASRPHAVSSFNGIVDDKTGVFDCRRPRSQKV